jgi:hypothetical protein
MVTLKDPSGATRVVVKRSGAAIASIRTGDAELLCRAPWADEDWAASIPRRTRMPNGTRDTPAGGTH